MMTTEEVDREVRLSVYRHFVRTRQAPSLDDTSQEVGIDPASVTASLERLDANHVGGPCCRLVGVHRLHMIHHPALPAGG
jgi:hypothetical protein